MAARALFRLWRRGRTTKGEERGASNFSLRRGAGLWPAQPPGGPEVRPTQELLYTGQRRVRHLRAEALEPLEPLLAPEPGDLALGVLPGIALGVEHRVARTEFAAYQLERLLVAVRFEGFARGSEAER